MQVVRWKKPLRNTIKCSRTGEEGLVMPTFDFECLQCGNQFSDFVSIKDREKVHCPKCQGAVKQRFTGFLFVKKGGSEGSFCSGGSCNTCSGCH